VKCPWPDSLPALLQRPPSPAFRTIQLGSARRAATAGDSLKPSCAAIKGDPSLPGGRVNQPQVILIDRPPLDRL
jgi:hypothetical protein